MLIKQGDIMSVKQFNSKRRKVLCTLSVVNGLEETYTLKQIYCPAPKSTLKKQSSFSKFKGKIKV